MKHTNYWLVPWCR